MIRNGILLYDRVPYVHSCTECSHFELNAQTDSIAFKSNRLLFFAPNFHLDLLDAQTFNT